MSLRWILFAIANYILLVVYSILFVYSLRFSIESALSNKDLGYFMLFSSCLLIIVINSILNLVVFHKFLPARYFSRKFKIVYWLSALLYTAGLINLMVELIQTISEESKQDPGNTFVNFLIIILILTSSFALYILINQLMVPQFIKKNHEKIMKDQIDELGKTVT